EQYSSIENFPVSDWVTAVAEGSATYVTKPQKRAKLKEEYRNRKSPSKGNKGI
nr:hypothetical protein [Bacteroidota bacterium]